MRIWPKNYLLQMLFLAALYFLAARYSLLLAVPPGNATAIWPPAGIALAALLLCGLRLWPAVWLAAVLANFIHTDVSAGVAALIGTGNTLQALIAAWLITRFIRLDRHFQSAEDVFKFTAFAALSAAIAAIIGTLSLAWGGFLGREQFAFNWWTWWIGDSASLLIVTPLILAWTEPAGFGLWRNRRYEMTAYAGLLVGVLWLIFSDLFGYEIRRLYLAIPFVVWAAYRFDYRFVTAVIVFICAYAVSESLVGHGIFHFVKAEAALLSLQAFMCTVALTGLALTAVTGQRERAMAGLGRSNAELESRVRSRTLELAQANEILRSDIEERQRIELALRASEARIQASNEQLRSLSARLESVRESERAAIAREVHDELGQVLTAVTMDLKVLEQHARALDDRQSRDRLLGEIVSIGAVMQQAIETVQKIAIELRPPVLDDLGLLPAIEWQAQNFERRSRIPCRVASRVASVDISKDRAIAIFRITQEALTNVARHAQAKSVLIEISLQERVFVIEVRDDGIGIGDADIHDARSIGLLGMRERATSLGGEVVISGAPGKGTAVAIRMPVEHGVVISA